MVAITDSGGAAGEGPDVDVGDGEKVPASQHGKNEDHGVGSEH